MDQPGLVLHANNTGLQGCVRGNVFELTTRTIMIKMSIYIQILLKLATSPYITIFTNYSLKSRLNLVTLQVKLYEYL